MSETPKQENIQNPNMEKTVFIDAITKQAEAVSKLESPAGRFVGEASLRLSKAATEGEV